MTLAATGRALLLGLSTTLIVPALAGCSKTSTGSEVAVEQPPPAPAMPPGWEVETDEVIGPAQLPGIEAKLGGKLKALRNTVYRADGHRIQLNVIVAASAVDADHIERALGKMKAGWAFRRKGEVLYEFVGNDAAADEIKKGQANLKP